MNWIEPQTSNDRAKAVNQFVNRTRKLHGACGLPLLLLLAVTAVHAADEPSLIRYNAQPTGSTVKMEGTSTIHDWTVESTLVGGFMEAAPGFPESALTNAQAARPTVTVSIPVRSLKSYARKMDEVMQEHLDMAKFPKIEYRLIELKPKTNATPAQLQFDAVGALTVSGTTRTNTMPVAFERIAGGKLKVTGSIPLKMTDFGVKPPAPSILGMPLIKTGDDIKISFEWLTSPKSP
jgi:hypothetical protein